MSTDTALAPAKWVADAWPSIQAAVTKGLAQGPGAKQLKEFAETGEGTDARTAIRIVTEQPATSSIAAAVNAHLDDTYDLAPAPLPLRVTRNGVTMVDSNDERDAITAITSWATGAREAELVWLCTWIATQPTSGSESVLNADNLDRDAAIGARLLLAPAAAPAATTRGIVHLVRRDERLSSIRLPPTFQYLRHADFDLTWRAGDQSQIELELAARVRLTGWDAMFAYLYRTVDPNLS